MLPIGKGMLPIGKGMLPIGKGMLPIGKGIKGAQSVHGFRNRDIPR